MRQKSWNQFKKTMAASTLAGAITFTGCAVMPSVTAFADTTEQTGQVSYDNEVMPIHTDVQTEAKPLMKGTSCTVSDGKNLYYAFEMMGVRMGIMKYNTKTGKKSEVYSYKIGKNKKGSNGFSQLSVDKKYIYATWDRYYGTDATKEYIYRIAKDGKSAKKLAIGRDPQLVDARFYSNGPGCIEYISYPQITKNHCPFVFPYFVGIYLTLFACFGVVFHNSHTHTHHFKRIIQVLSIRNRT